jgi:hypothetical protein
MASSQSVLSGQKQADFDVYDNDVRQEIDSLDQKSSRRSALLS